MGYQIKKISDIQLNDYPCYFLDANIWIIQLKYSYSSGILSKTYHQKYIEFIEKLVVANVNNPKSPKIVVLSLLVSEVFNTYIRNVAMPEYLKSTGLSNLDFKKDYRPTQHYKDSFQKLWDDFKSFEDFIILKDDGITNLNFFNDFDVLTLGNSDFNDFYYLQWAKKNQIPIITDDADFLFEGVPIITANNNLLKHR